MSTLQRILVAHSLFPDGDIALRSAAVLAERAQAALYLLHVVEPYPVYQRLRFPTVPAHAMIEEVVLKVRAQLNDLAASPLLARLPVETDAHVGKPFVEIVKACRAWQANVIVMGVSPRGPDRFLGSTGERVLRKSPVPVLLAKCELLPGPKTVLIPIDFSPASRDAAVEALALVRGFGGRAVFLHVLDLRYLYPAVYGVEPVIVPPVRPEELEPEWQEFLGTLSLTDIAWEKQTREGPAALQIASAATALNADVVVIGTHGRTGVAHMLLGSVAEAVLKLTECSVLTVRPEAFRFELP